MNSCNDKRMWKILVFPAGTEIGLEIYNSLRNCKEVCLFAAGQDLPNHAQFLFDEYHVIPSIYESDCLSRLEDLVRLLEIDYIFPAYDDVIVELSRAGDYLRGKVIAPSQFVAELTRSKSRTYEYLRDSIPVPIVYRSELEVDHYPVLVKPDEGQGSFGVVRVDNQEQLLHALKTTRSPIISEYLPGDEYTIDCFSDRDLGLLFAGARVRKRMRSGISVNTETVDSSETYDYARIIGKKLGLCGAWFFQMKRSSSGELKLLEVAPRIAGSMATHRVLGVNFPLLSIFERERLPLSVLKNEGQVVLDRALKNRYRHRIAFDTLYVDLDDTLILNGKTNADVIRLIYMCLNEGKKIVLLTKHQYDLNETLRRYRLAGLFDEVLHIGKNELKSSYIKDKKSIFVDDSFSERRDVFLNHGIPTFDASMIEILIDGVYYDG